MNDFKIDTATRVRLGFQNLDTAILLLTISNHSHNTLRGFQAKETHYAISDAIFQRINTLKRLLESNWEDRLYEYRDIQYIVAENFLHAITFNTEGRCSDHLLDRLEKANQSQLIASDIRNAALSSVE